MTKKVIACLALAGLVALGGPAIADIGTIDAVPAATLLLPYFEVDLDACDEQDGFTTLFSVNNASAAPQIAHVTLWTDQSIPSLDFDIYLTGYDVETLNLRDLFCSGQLPRTADEFADPEDDAIGIGISPNGNLTPDFGDEDFPGTTGPCGNPYGGVGPGAPSTLGPDLLAHIRGWHTGGPSPVIGPGNCAGSSYEDNVARGYITIDNVNQCNIQFPTDEGYFGDPESALANNNNVLWGDYFYVDTPAGSAQGETLVHVEACNGTPAGFGPPANGECPFLDGDYTFYGSIMFGAQRTSGDDQREPLGTQFASRYIMPGGLIDGTDLIVWRDAKTRPATDGFTCGLNEAWFPLDQTDVVAFDEFEQAVNLCAIPGSNLSPPREEDQSCFPVEAQRVRLGDNQVPGGIGPNPPFDSGWIFLNLNHTARADNVFGPTAQAWVTTVIQATDQGLFSVGYNAIQLDNASDTQGTAGTVLIPD